MSNDTPIASDPLIGQVLAGQYVIEAMIAKGGMGNIYLATQARLGRQYAVKVLRSEFCTDDKVIKRFIREALAVSQLRHPHTVQVFDSGETSDGVHFIVMEYLEGESLDRRITRTSGFEQEQAITFVGQAAAALAEAHSKGIVHRDLKPANIFIVSAPGVPEFVKVLDFGIAKFYTGVGVKRELTKLTAAGSTMGTPHYMAPEQIRGEDVDGRADIYSLAVILWESIIGTPPYQGDSPMEIFLGHLEQRPPVLSEALGAPGLPNLDALVMRALAKRPADRYQSMAEFKMALDGVLGVGMDPNRLMVSQRLRVGDLPPMAKDHLPTQPEGFRGKAKSKSSWLLVLVALAAATLVLVIGALLFNSKSTSLGAGDAETVKEVPNVVSHVKVFSHPSGVQVLVDGEAVGVTPLHLKVPREGAVKMVFSGPNLQPLTIQVETHKSAVAGVIAIPELIVEEIGLEDEMTIWLESDPPGASLFMEGRTTGWVTPYSLPVEDDQAEFTLKRPGFLDEHFTIFGHTQRTLVVSSSLVPSGERGKSTTP